MKNRDLILMLIEKSLNAFGNVIGQTQEDKLRTELSITRSAIQDSFKINSNDLTKKILADILSKMLLTIEQVHQLSDLLWTQAELLLKLNRPQEGLIQFTNVLQLLYWNAEQPAEKGNLDRKNKIKELEALIVTLKLPSKMNTIN